MSKATVFVVAACMLAAVAFAGTTGSTCKNAVELRMNELYEGDTSAFDPTAVQCQTYKYSPKGIWYHYKGEDKAVVLDTCDQRTAMDSVIFVFTSCDEEGGYINQCLTMDDDGCNQRQSRVMFTAEQDQDYYVYVAGFLNSTGVYYLATSEVLPPENYQCHKAIEAKNFPFSIDGETGTCQNVRDRCQFGRPAAGLWYKVPGNGKSYLAHTCNSNTNYDSAISVFGNCTEEDGAGNCIIHNNDACYRASMVSWQADSGKSYWIFVTGYNNARGRFTLAIEERSYNENSYCFEAIVITAIPYYYNGRTDYRNTTFSECRDQQNVHAMYFRVQGNNRKMVVTTCTSSSTVNDSVIDVYSHCDKDEKSDHYGSGMTCVASNDDYCGLGAQVVFFAASDSYYIAVSAASPTLEGVYFSLAVRPYEDTENSQCWFAQDIDSFPDVLLGNTTHYEECEQSCDGSKVKRRGGWFRYTHFGPSKTITATTCNQFNQLSARIEVYHDCNEMGCVQQADPDKKTKCTNATFVAENGRTYNIFVTAADPKSPGGYFHVDFYEEDPSEHSTCNQSYFIQRGALPWRIQDNTMMSQESFSSCQNKSTKGIWVSVIGTGTRLVATTCDQHTGYDTVLELYNHCPDEADVNGSHCMRINDDNPSCGRSSEIEWMSTPGAYYWLFVTGFAGSSGIFVLNVYEKDSMINAQCRTAVGIRKLPYFDYGLTTYCQMSNASCKKVPRKGNWYEIVGNDHWITVSTCHEVTDFATEIEVYLACNENGGEICVNHNHDYSCSPQTEITFAGVKDELFYIFITGADEHVMAEGFFGVTVTEGEKLPQHLSSSSEEEGLTSFEGFMISVGVLMGCGLIAACCAVGYGIFKRRHVSYQEISTSG